MYYLTGDRRRFLRRNTFFIRVILKHRIECTDLVKFFLFFLLLLKSNKTWHFSDILEDACCTFYETLLRTKKRERYDDPVVGFARYIDLPTTWERKRGRERGTAPVNTLGREYQGLQNEKYRSPTMMILHLQANFPFIFRTYLWIWMKNRDEKLSSSI